MTARKILISYRVLVQLQADLGIMEGMMNWEQQLPKGVNTVIVMTLSGEIFFRGSVVYQCFALIACQKHKTTSRMSWISIPCRQFRKDKLHDHEKSKCHIEAVKSEVIAATSRRTGGIQAAVEDQVNLQCQAVRGAFKCMYWLEKEEIAHHMKFSSILELGKFLGCSCLSELDVAKNAKYTSHRTFDEFLTILSNCLEDEMLSKIRASPAIGILCDETTDVANLKQLVVLVQYLVGKKVKTSFLKLV